MTKDPELERIEKEVKSLLVYFLPNGLSRKEAQDTIQELIVSYGDYREGKARKESLNVLLKYFPEIEENDFAAGVAVFKVFKEIKGLSEDKTRV